ncbi:hypothetical protein [Actinobacillus equuli]|nr:hypothetical protein [Actinobacillus equuli]WGE76067.1 hypothetical protein NYR81_03745 [Actinobacillus equuli subsp. haemolyticus]WGE78062.1 hypothetical protein NYR82_04275 [Actinobacillus equuli subsp. haemolyticus]
MGEVMKNPVKTGLGKYVSTQQRAVFEQQNKHNQAYLRQQLSEVF